MFGQGNHRKVEVKGYQICSMKHTMQIGDSILARDINLL